MKGIDIVLLAIIALGAIQGYRKGFLMEVVSISAFIVAVIAGFKLLHVGIDFLRDNFHLSGKWLPYLSFLLIFVGIIILMNVIGRAVKKVLDMTLFGGFDNMVGALVGSFKWIFGISVLIWIFNYFQICNWRCFIVVFVDSCGNFYFILVIRTT